MTQEDLIKSLNSRLNPDALLGEDPVVAQGENSEEFEAQKRIAERRRAEDRERQYQKSLQANRDLLGSVASPVERKRLESFYSLEQKRTLLDNHTVEKRYGLDGFKKMRIDFMDDGDSGYLVDKDGKRYAFRSSSGGSVRFDAPDYKDDVERSRYKFGIQPQTVARAYGKSVNELTDEDYANYEAYAQAESVKRLTATTPYQSEKFDPNKKYQKLNPMGLEVYARMEGKDMYDRYLATIYNPATGQDLGYESGLDPNVNTNYSLFNSLATRGNYQRSLDAQRMGEYFRDQVEPENGYVDPDATIRRWYREYGKVYNDDSFPVAALRQFGSSALSTLGNIGVAITESPDKRQGKEEPYFNLHKYADKEMADMLLGQSDARRQEYADYMNNVSSKFESGDIKGGLWEFIKHPTQVSMFVAEQLGNMAPGLLATAATGGTSLASFGAATATDLLANIGMDFMEFRKNHGRSMSASEMAKAYLRQLPAAALDALSDKILVGNSNVLKTARYTPLRATGEVAKEMGVEGTQEVTQNIASLMNSEDKSFDEALKDPSNISNFMLGALGGGLMSGPVGAGQVTRHMVRSAAFQQFKQKYEAKFDQQAADAGDTLAADHRQQRENFISSTLDNYQQAKSAGDSTAMFGSITSLKAKLDDAQSGLSAYDKEHIKSTLYDVVNDTISNLVKSGAMDSATESVLNQLKDSLGIQDNEQLKRDLAKYAEVYGSAANGRLATQNDTYENDHDRQIKAEQFETLIENLGGTKAEARKLLEEVAEENITSKTEGFDSYLAAAKKAKEEGDTHTFEGKVSDMSDRIESMAIKHGKLVNGLKDEMNKGAAVDSKGMLSNDKIHIKYGFDKNSAKRGEEVSFDTSFKQEAFNYSTRGGIYRTADQISSEVQYMAEQLNSLEGVSQETKDKVNALVSQVKQNDDLLEHLGYELHRGIKGGAKFNAEQESDVELSKERHAEIKEAMESYFNQYVAPRSASQSEKLTAKEAYQLKKYTSGLSLSELKSFQKSLDPKKDSIAYEGVSAVIKNRERNIGIASSHDAWLKANRVNGKYNAATVQQPQAQAQSQPKPQVKPQEKPSTARDLKITKSKIDKATDIDELIESGAYIDNLITTVSDPSHKDYKNKSLMRKLKSIKKAIAERIAKLEAQDASESPQNGSESTETGQGEQPTTDTQKGSQNGSESSETVLKPEIDNSDAYNAEERLMSIVDRYTSEFSESMSSEEIKSIIEELNDQLDVIDKSDDKAFKRHWDTVENLLNSYKHLLEDVIKREEAEAVADANSLFNDETKANDYYTCQDLINAYSTINSNLTADEYASIVNKLFEAFQSILKYTEPEFKELNKQLRELYHAYRQAEDEARNKEGWGGLSEKQVKLQETIQELKDRLINTGKRKDGKSDKDVPNVIGEMLFSQWNRDAKLKVFAEKYKIADLSEYFKLKAAAMSLDAGDERNAEALKELKRRAVELLSGAVMQMSERIVPYTKRDRESGKPDPRTLGRINSKTGKFEPYSSWNDIIANMFRNNPHLQMLYAPDVVEAPKNMAFATVQSVKMNENVAAAILLATLEFFANRSVAPLFNPQSRDEIAAAFGTTSEAADPILLDTYAKVSRRWGVFKGTISSTIGRMIMDNLGLGRSPELRKKLIAVYPNAVAALGDLGLVMAEQLGLVTVTDVYTGELSNIDSDNYAEEKARYDRCAHLSELGLTRGDASNLGLGNSKIRHFYKFNDTKEVDEKLKSMWLGPMTGVDENGQPIISNGKIERDESMGFKQFKTGVDTLTRTPKLSVNDVHNKAGRRKQEEFKLTPDRMEVLNEASKAPYYINSQVLDELLNICNGDMTRLRSMLLKRMGHKNIVGTKKFSQLSYDEQQKIKGKNENLERELDYLLDYWKLQKALVEAGEFEGYYFEFFGSANNRSFLDSNTVNPQTAKTATRFLMQPNTTEQSYKLDSRTTIEKELFAVAQAFNCLKEYYRSNEFKQHDGVSLAGKLLGLDVIGDLKAVEERLALLKNLRRDLLMQDSDANRDTYEELGWNGKVENFGQACVAIDHCIRRLESIANNNGEAKGAKKIKSYLSVENDSTTSGYVIKFLLMPLDESLLKDYGPKVGFLNPDLIDSNPNFSPEFKKRLKSYKSIDQLKADPEFLDIYKTAAVEMIQQYEIMHKKLKDTGVTMGEDVFGRMCLKKNKKSKSEADKYIPTRLGEHLANSGMTASSINKGFEIINDAIPKPKHGKVSSILRNLMKPIVMIFGYNASDESCRKRFAEAVMDEHINDFLKLYHNDGLAITKNGMTVSQKGYELLASDSKDVKPEEKARANAIAKFMLGAAIRVTGIVDNNEQALEEFAKQLSEKSPYAIRFLPAKQGVSINETLSLAEWYQLTIGGTYGQAVTNFLSEKFGIYGEANRALNNVSRVMFKVYSFFRTKLINKKFDEMTDLDNGTLQKPSNNSIVQRLRSKYRDKLHFTNHSGGAEGSDNYWGTAGKQYQVVSRHYYLGTTSKYNAPYGNTPLTEREMVEGKEKATAAGYAMGRLTAGRVKDPKLIRNWNQVKYSDAVFAVANGFIKKGEQISDDRIANVTQVKGGTGWAVQMAITEGKPVYVYIQQGRDAGWYTYDPDLQDFTKMIAMPMLTPNFAGIGTRRLNNLGKRAIDDLYKNTFVQNGKIVPDAGMYIKLQPWMLNISDLTGNELNEIDKAIKPLFPMFPAAGVDMNAADKERYYIRSVENASLSLEGSSAYTEMWKKDNEGNYITGYATDGNPDHRLVSKSYDSLNSYGDLNELSPGMRMLAVLMIHFTDGALAQRTMNKMLSAKAKRFLTVVHDAFVLSAKDSNDIGKAFNEALYKICMEFNPFEMISELMGGIYKDGTSTGLRDVALKMADKMGISAEEMNKLFDEPLFSHDGTDIKDSSYDVLSSQMGFYGQKSRQLKETILSPQGKKGIVIANLGGDIKSSYKVTEQVEIPVSKVTMSTLTEDEKEELQEGDALGSKASAWKDKYDIDSIEKEANSSKEGRAKMFNALNEYDKAYGMVENSEEYLNDVQSLFNEINPERFTNLPLETATSKTGTVGKGVYFTGANGGQRRITIIKPSAISSAADQRSRFVSRQTSMAAVYAHELIHPAVGEAIANPDAYGVTREVDILKQFHDDIGKELTPEFFRPSDYDTYTEAEKKLADQSAQETYDYMFNNPDKDTIGGLQEFVAWAVTDPRMREYLKNRQASSYSKEYNGKNTLQKIMYILKHIFKAMFGNTESRKKVMATLTRVGTESRKQTNTLDAMQKLIVEISHANRYAANKLNNNKLSKLENVFEALGSALQIVKPVNDFVSDKVKWIFDLGGVSNRFERTYKSLEEIIRAQGITENGSKMDTLKTLLLCPFSHNMRVALTDTLIGCCSLGQRSTFAHLIRDISDKDDATRQLETLASNRTNIDRMSRGVGAAYSAEILEAFEGKLSEEDSVALTKAGIGCDLQSLLTNGYTVKEIQELASGVGIEEAIKSHELAIAKHYEKAKNGKKMATWTRNQCIGLAHFMNTNKGNPSQCLNAYDIARGFLSSSINDKADEKLVGHIDCLASLYAVWNARPEDRLAISKMNAKGLETVLKCHRDLVAKSFNAGYIERTHMIKGWHSSIIDDTKAYAVAPVDPATRKQMEEDGYKLYNDQALPVDGMTNAILGFYVKDMITPEHRQGAALQITGKRSMGQSLNSFMENNPDIIGDRRDYITKQIKKAHAIRMRMQNTMETEEDLTYEDFTNRGIVGSYYTPIINPKGQVVDFRITMFNDFKDEAMKRDNNVLSVISKMGMTHAVKTSAGDQNLNIVHFLVDDMEKNMDPNTHTVRRQYENLGEVILGSQERRNKHDIKYIKLQIDPDSEFIAPDIPAAIVPSEMREAMRKLEKHGDGLWIREDWLYQIFGTPEMSMADMEVFKKENMRAVRNGIRFAEHLIKAIATLAKVAIVFKKPAVIIGNAISNYLFHLMNGQNPVTAARMDTENLQLIMEYMKMEKDINRLDLKKDIGEATPAEKAQLTRLRAHLEHSPIHELVQAGLFSAVVEDTSKKDQDAIKVMLRKITENEQLKKTAKSIVGDVFDMDTKLGQAAGQLYMREGTPIYDFIYTMTQYSDFVSRATDYRIGMRNMPEKIRSNADLRRKYKKALIEQIRDDYINYDIPQSKLMNYVNAMGYTFFTKYFFRIQRIIRRTTTRRPLMSFAMMATNSRFDMPDNIFEQAPWHKNYGAIVHTPWENATDLLPPPLLNLFGFFG